MLTRTIPAFLAATTLLAGEACLAQQVPSDSGSGCALVEPKAIVLVNDQHKVNFGPPPIPALVPFGAVSGPFCVQDEVVAAEICLPLGVVAGSISFVREPGASGLAIEQTLPGVSGPHCKVAQSTIRPDHGGTGPNYQCFTRAVVVVHATLAPLRKVAVCEDP